MGVIGLKWACNFLQAHFFRFWMEDDNMMRLSNLQTAGLCRELALLLHAGVSVGDGLSLLAQEESAAALQPVLENMGG